MIKILAYLSLIKSLIFQKFDIYMAAEDHFVSRQNQFVWLNTMHLMEKQFIIFSVDLVCTRLPNNINTSVININYGYGGNSLS